MSALELNIINPYVISISGGVGSGGTSLARETARLLQIMGYQSICISAGHLFRTASYLAADEVCRRGAPKLMFEPAIALAGRPGTISPEEVAGLMVERHVRLQDGAVMFGSKPVPKWAVTDRRLGQITPTWSGTQPVHDAVMRIIAEQVNRFPGWVVVDGRSVTYEIGGYRFFLSVLAEQAAERKGLTIEQVLERDDADQRLVHGPLCQMPEDIPIDTSYRQVPEVARNILGHVGFERLPALQLA